MDINNIPNGAKVRGKDRRGKVVEGRIFADRWACRIANHVMVSVMHRAARGRSWVSMNVAVSVESVEEVK